MKALASGVINPRVKEALKLVDKPDQRLAHPVPSVCPWCKTKVERFQQKGDFKGTEMHKICSLEAWNQDLRARVFAIEAREAV